MIAREDIGKLVTYYLNGSRTGLLVRVEKKIAVIQTMVCGQRNKRVPVEDVDVYEK